uniref:Zinc finger, CCHC-type n=1 Tax=Tanacetum cinerariifolium TaxID=118510 RepID=A0A6L2JBF8_TANCI|nr:zinc finger, CCHC-type [Tanacetum cinerariifolium]
MLALTMCYPAFLITADVSVIYMHRFRDTVNKHGSSYRFKIDNKRFAVNVEVFREILSICPKIVGQEFVDPPTEDESLAFIKKLGHSREIKNLRDINDDLAYQINNKYAKKQDNMYNPRFTKAVINHFLQKNPSISIRNRMFMHTAKDDSVLGTVRFVYKHEDVQVYGALLLKEMTNPAMLTSESFHTYHVIVTGAQPPKLKKIHKKSDSTKSSEEIPPQKKSTRVKRSAKVSSAGSKKKATTKTDTGKGLKVLFEVALSKKSQLKEAIRLSKQDLYMSQASGSGAGTYEGTGTKPVVLDVPKRDSESETETWGDKKEEENIDERVPNPEDTQLSDKDNDEEKSEELGGDYEILYRDVNVNLRTKDVHITNVNQGRRDEHHVAQDSGLQYEDAHVTLTASQKTEGQTQSSSVSSDFTRKLLNFKNVSPVDYSIASVMDTTAQQTSHIVITTTPLPPSLVLPPTQQETPTHAPTIQEPITTAPPLPDFASVFRFDQRVSLEQEVSQLKQADNFVQIFESIKSRVLVIVDEHLSSRLGFAVQTDFQSYVVDFEKEAQAEHERFIEVIDKLVKEMVKDEVKSQLRKILPTKISDFATTLIKSIVAESYENVVLAKSSSQPTSTYESAASLTEFELKKILLDKMEQSKSYDKAPKHKDLYECLTKSYKLDKDLFETYGQAYSLKRDREDKDKDEDPFAGLDRGTPHSPHKSAHEKEPCHDSSVPHDQEFDTSNNDDQPTDEASTKDDWFKKPDKPSTPDQYLSDTYVVTMKMEILLESTSNKLMVEDQMEEQPAKDLADSIVGLPALLLVVCMAARLDKFEGIDFRRWQKKMYFLLSSMSVVYVLTTPVPNDGGDDPTVEQVRKRAKWDNDDYICRGTTTTTSNLLEHP